MPRRHPLQREKDLAELASRYLHGQRQAEIAEALGVTQQQISADLKTLQARWQQSALIDLNEAKSRELAKTDELERVYWAEWEASRQEKQITQTRRKGEGQAAQAEAMLRRERREGNPAYLAGVQWCIERRCKILGLDAPQKVAPTDPSGKNEYRNHALVSMLLADQQANQLAHALLGRLAGDSGGAGLPLDSGQVATGEAPDDAE